MLRNRQTYAFFLLTIFSVWLSASVLPSECCCVGDEPASVSSSAAVSSESCHAEEAKLPADDASGDTAHCDMSLEIPPLEAPAEAASCCDDAESDELIQQLAAVSHQCSMQCMLINAVDTDNADSFVVQNNIASIASSVITSVKRLPQLLFDHLYLAESTLRPLQPPLFMLHSAYLI